MPNRYNGVHIDLLDQLTFYGASRRKFSLDMWCKTFGIKSPQKEEGITGYDIKNLFADKRYLDIARYCLRRHQGDKGTVWILGELHKIRSVSSCSLV